MKRETYVLVPAVDSAGRVLNGSIQWDALLTELERSLAHAHGYSGNACLGCGIGSHDKRLSDRALVALALIQYLSCAMFGARNMCYCQSKYTVNTRTYTHTRRVRD